MSPITKILIFWANIKEVATLLKTEPSNWNISNKLEIYLLEKFPKCTMSQLIQIKKELLSGDSILTIPYSDLSSIDSSELAEFSDYFLAIDGNLLISID